MPEEILNDPSCATWTAQGYSADAIATLLTAGYTPALLQSGWDQITDGFLASFGDKYFNVPIIPTDIGKNSGVPNFNGQYPFPPVNPVDGCVYSPPVPNPEPGATCYDAPPSSGVPDQNHDLIALVSRKFPGKLTVEFENLHFALNKTTGQGKPSQPNQKVVDYGENLGTIPSYQMNNYYGPFPTAPGGTSCGALGKLERCFPEYYGELLQTGIAPASTKDPSLRSQFIEAFFPDIYGTNGTECTQAPPSPPNTKGSKGYQVRQYPPTTQPECAYPNEILQGHKSLVDPPVVAIRSRSHHPQPTGIRASR